MDNNIKTVYGVGYFNNLISFIEPYSLTGSFKTLAGNKVYFLNGKLHREDGPAIEYADGTKCWYLNGKCHRVGGPAIEYADGDKSWYLNGEKYTEEEFNTQVKNNIR